MADIAIRPATPDDAAAIARIYNQGIVDRMATLETELRTAEERGEFLAAHGPRHPVIVAETARVVVGWASLNVFNPRPAYESVADLSVYVERGWRGRGGGRLPPERLGAPAKEIGYHKMVLAALARNAAGVALYERVGFSRVGIYREQGRLDGEWVDVLIMERVL